MNRTVLEFLEVNVNLLGFLEVNVNLSPMLLHIRRGSAAIRHRMFSPHPRVFVLCFHLRLLLGLHVVPSSPPRKVLGIYVHTHFDNLIIK